MSGEWTEVFSCGNHDESAMSTRRHAYKHRGLTKQHLDDVRPKVGLKVYRCSYCADRLASVRDVVPHEAHCVLRVPVELLRAKAWRKFVRSYEDQRR